MTDLLNLADSFQHDILELQCSPVRSKDCVYEVKDDKMISIIGGLSTYRSALREADAELKKLQTKLNNCHDEAQARALRIISLNAEIKQLRAENERLKGKIVSPDVTTMCYCDDCGAATRWGRHLDIDCETIKSLRDQNIIYVTAISGLHEQIGKLRAEVQRFWDIFSPDVSIEMLEEGLQARAELQKLRAELEEAKALVARHEAALKEVQG